jgi:HlyD family secretion protein
MGRLRLLRRLVGGALKGPIAGLLAGGLVLGLLAGCAGGPGRRQPEIQRSAQVERGTMRITVSASGIVEPARRASLVFAAPGRVAEVLVHDEETVAAGDVLARLDTGQLALQVEQAEAALAQAQAGLAQLRDQPTPEQVAEAEANLEAAQAQVSAAAASRDQVQTGVTEADIAAARAQVASAETQVKVARDNRDRVVRDTDDEDRIAQADYSLFAAREALEAAQAELDRLLSGADEEELRGARANVQAAVARSDAAQAQLDLLLAGPREEQLADAEAQVAQAEAALALARLALQDAVLEAPFAGIVSQINVVEGEVSPTMLPAVVLLDPSGYQVSISVDELDVGRLQEGMTAEVVLEPLPDQPIQGTITHISPLATVEGGVIYYEVIIDLDPADLPLRVDMSATAAIVVEELEDVLTVPNWVLRVDRTTGQTFVERPTEQGIERVDVELGARHDGAVQVLEGLDVGETVVLRSDSLFGVAAP